MIKIQKKAKEGQAKKEGNEEEGTEENLLRAGDSGIVRMRFIGNPEIIRIGQKLVFREARTKGVGEVTEVFAMAKKDDEKEKKKPQQQKKEVKKEEKPAGLAFM